MPFKEKNDFSQYVVYYKSFSMIRGSFAGGIVIFVFGLIGLAICLVLFLSAVGVCIWLIINSTHSKSNPSHILTTTMTVIVNTFFQNDCGVPSITPKLNVVKSNRIINGEPAIPFSWPWAVSLRTSQFGSLVHICGGTLIGSSYIMTAAHCVITFPNVVVVAGIYLRHF